MNEGSGSDWGTNYKLSGICYLALRFKWNPDVFGGIPTVQAKIKGKKMFFASHPSVYTLPGTWESQSDIMYDPTLLVVSASVVFATAAIVSVLAIKKKRRKV